MKNTNSILMLPLTILAISLSCSKECNDCLELTSKSIKYIDANGANLLYGSQAIYDPDSITVKAGNDNDILVEQREEDGTIAFNIEAPYTTYYLVLPGSWMDTLDLELAERKSTLCCGNVVYSTKTLLNGSEIENDDLIVIAR